MPSHFARISVKANGNVFAAVINEIEDRRRAPCGSPRAHECVKIVTVGVHDGAGRGAHS